MCGINGLYYFDRSRRVEESLVDRMRAAILHRGPDDRGVYRDGNVGLGFNRLSIIDLSGGSQPMSNEDGSVWVIFNGEIYNFVELRDDLLARGHKFRTRSDTETIVHAWEEYGEGCVERLRGMFAFALWDVRKRLLFGARDRLGIKPFYYYADDQQFAFASEMKALLEIPEIPRQVDPEALAQFLRHRYVIAPGTILRGVSKLPPGHTVTVSESGWTVRRYWDVPADTVEIRESDALAELSSLLGESVRLHLVSDVPLGAFLSGGLDSSSVVAWMSELGVRDIKTFSVGYDAPVSELDYARQVAEHFHTDHHELVLTPGMFRDALERAVWNMDEPVGDEASIPLYCLSRFARQHVTVALSGEGADEIFAGYPIYRIMMALEAANRVPGARWAGWLGQRLGEGKLAKYAGMLGRPLEARYGGVSHVFSHAQMSRLCPLVRDLETPPDGLAAFYRRRSDCSALARMSYLDLKTWLADDLLVKADRMSMAHSLELRVPLLDHKLVEFAMRLPENLKIRGAGGKYLWKRCMESRLPRNIVHRVKRGFPVPLGEWFGGELSGFVRETLLASGGAGDLFSRPEMERVLDRHTHGWDCSGQIFALVIFDQWYRSFVDHASRPQEVLCGRA